MKYILYALFLIFLCFLIIEPLKLTNIFPYGCALLLFNLISIALVCSKDDALSKTFRHWIIKHYKGILILSFIGAIAVIALIINKKIPYDLPLFIISALVIVFTIPLGNKNNFGNKKLIFVGVVFAVSCINWMFVSYISYYSGVTQALKEEANILQSATYEVMMLDHMTEDEKKQLLDNIYQQTRGEIEVTKNEKLFKKGGRGRNYNEYELETQGRTDSFVYGNDYYYVSFKYGNRPFWDIGLVRAMSFSTFPDWLDYRTGEVRKVDNKGYLKYGAYRRSTNLWSPFWVLYLIFVVLCYYVVQLDVLRKEAMQTRLQLVSSIADSNRAKEEAVRAQNELKKVEANLKNAQSQLTQMIESKAQIYQHMAAEMQQEMRDITTSQAKNTLQKMISNWSDKKRDVFARKEYAQGLSAMETAAHDTRHILVNKWTANEMYEKHPDDVKPYVDEILEDLKAIPNVISVKMEDFSVQQIMDSILEQYGKYRKEPQVKFSCNVAKDGSINTLFCHANLHRINSIVFNLLSNSVKITNKFRKKYLDEHDEDDDDFKEYIRKVDLFVGVTDYNNKKHLLISVKDNGGGFADSILNKIYREPVKSEFRTKGSIDQHRSEMGEGTSYIGFFVEMMDGEIVAKNHVDKDGFKGASTEILLPIINNKGLGD